MKKQVNQITSATLLRELNRRGEVLARRLVLKGLGALTGVAWLAGCAQPLTDKPIITGTRLPLGERRKDQPGGLSISTTRDVTLENNIVYDNERAQLRVWETVSRTTTDYETGANEVNRAERQTYRHNVFVGVNAEQFCAYLPGKEARADGQSFQFFYDSLLSDENLFYNPVRQDVFLTHLATAENTEDRSTATYRDLQGWQEYSGEDENSLFFSPHFANPEKYIFQLTGRSPRHLRDWDLPRKPAA